MCCSKWMINLFVIGVWLLVSATAATKAEDCNSNGVLDESDIGNQGVGFDDASSWTTYDHSADAECAADPGCTSPVGYRGAVFADGYVYFAANYNGSEYHAEILRYNTDAGFSEASSWETFDPGAEGGYTGTVFDGRYVYYVPYHGGGVSGVVLRYDTLQPFSQPDAWETFNAEAGPLNANGGYIGAVFDGRFVYFVPYHDDSAFHGEVLRYDTWGGFADVSAWTTFDPGEHGLGTDPDGFMGAVFDDHRYVYFVPFANQYAQHHGEVLRLDTWGAFADVSSWQVFDPGEQGVGNDPDGYQGAVFDGQYVYFVPNRSEAYGTHSGEVMRYDTSGDFVEPSSWTTYDPGDNGIGNDPDGYTGGAFDGQFIYFAPFHNGTEHHGEVLRYDTFAGWSFDCNGNDIPDECDLTACDGSLWCLDCDDDDVPDGCELEENDCNTNGIPDECDLASGMSADANANGIPDECDLPLVFCDDFGVFDTAQWTHHGSNAVNVNDMAPGAVHVHGAVNWSPASRITHIQSTRTGDFDVKFDIRRLAYNGSGSVAIGWMNVDEFASVQKHDSSYQNLYGWETHDSAGNLSSGLFIFLNSGSGDTGTAPHRSGLKASDEGTVVGYDQFDPGLAMAGGVWLTVNFGRAGTTGYFEAIYHDTGGLAIGRVEIDLPNQANYDYFQISSIDGLSNSWWVDFEIDNLCLSIEPSALALDIKPGSCPNPLNRSSHGVLPVAIVGTEDFDVAEIDVASVRLTRADGVGGEAAPNEGPPGPHSTIEDVATPFEGELCDCHDAQGDGIDDLSMKFWTQDVVEILQLGDLDPETMVELVVTGILQDGTEFTTGGDCIWLLSPPNHGERQATSSVGRPNRRVQPRSFGRQTSPGAGHTSGNQRRQMD